MIAISIDGPAGAGKSTIAKAVAQKLDFIYVDTGALYRTVALYVLEHNVSSENKEDILKLLPEIDIKLKFEEGTQKVFLCGTDVTKEIRQPQISMAASKISAIKEVRDFLFSLQKDFAKKHNVLMDGRDIGTVVLPNANIKIFLTATCEERAKRRYKEMREKGININFKEVFNAIKKRDYNDTKREIAPLKPAKDAIIMDTTGNTLSKSIQCVLNVIKKNLK